MRRGQRREIRGFQGARGGAGSSRNPEFFRTAGAAAPARAFPAAGENGRGGRPLRSSAREGEEEAPRPPQRWPRTFQRVTSPVELTRTIAEVQAPEIWVTHGREEALVHHARTHGLRARALALVGYEEDDT